MSEIMKVGGRKSDGTAAAIGIDQNGNLRIKRVWETQTKNIFTGTLSNTTAVTTVSNVVNAIEWGMVSLRVNNLLNSDVKIMLYWDNSADGTEWMKDFNGEYVAFTVPAESQMIITPDDLPILNYLRYIKCRINAVTTPTNGKNLLVQAVLKR
jgi:hypothetical protein